MAVEVTLLLAAPAPSPGPGSIPRSMAAPCRMPFVERSLAADIVWLCQDLGDCSWTVDHAGWE